jgi:hypothetical protein
MIVDACRPFPWIDQFPPVNEISPELRRKIIDKWGKELGE